MYRLWMAAGCAAGLGAVAMAALAAHAMKGLPQAGAMALDRAVQMQGWHALALVGCGLWSERRPGRVVQAAGAAFLLGMVLFCGAVYALVLAGIGTGPLAPTGGLLLMLGWLLFGVSAAGR